MILESKEAVIASMMKISSPAVNLSKEDSTSQDPRGEANQAVGTRLVMCFVCSRLRTSGRGQLEVSRRRPGPGQHRRDPAPSQQQEAPLTHQVSAQHYGHYGGASLWFKYVC